MPPFAVKRGLEIRSGLVFQPCEGPGQRGWAPRYAYSASSWLRPEELVDSPDQESAAKLPRDRLPNFVMRDVVVMRNAGRC